MLYLIRHCEPEGARGRFIGRSDPGLSVEGRAHASRLAEALEGVGFSRIVSSPLARARESAAPLFDRLGLAPEIDAALVECDFGRWDGLSWDEVSERWPDDSREYLRDPAGFTFPGGEGSGALRARVMPTVRSLVPDEGAPPVAVFSHCGPIMTAVAEIMGCPSDGYLRVRIDYGSASVFEPAGARVLVTGINIDPTDREVLRWAR